MTGTIPTARTKGVNKAGLGLTLFALVVFTYSFFAGQDFRAVSSWFPVGVSGFGFVLALAVLLWELGIVKVGVSESLEDAAQQGETAADIARPAWRGFLDYMAWLVVLVAGMMVLGAPVAIFVWLVLFFRFKSKESWLRAVLSALAAVAGVVVLVSILHLFVPAGGLVPSGKWIPKLIIKF